MPDVSVEVDDGNRVAAVRIGSTRLSLPQSSENQLVQMLSGVRLEPETIFTEQVSLIASRYGLVHVAQPYDNALHTCHFLMRLGQQPSLVAVLNTVTRWSHPDEADIKAEVDALYAPKPQEGPLQITLEGLETRLDELRFTGEYRYSVDNRGRFTIPPQYRQVLQGSVWARIEYDHIGDNPQAPVALMTSDLIYADRATEVTQQKSRDEMRKFARQYASVDIDNQGRVNLPDEMSKELRLYEAKSVLIEGEITDFRVLPLL